MSKQFVSQFTQELGTALNVQNLGEIINDETDIENLDAKEVASKFISASNAKVESVMKNYLTESEKAKNLESELAKLKEEVSKAKDDGYKSAKRTFAEKSESLIKTKFGLQDSKAERFEDLIDELHARVNSNNNEPKNTDKTVVDLQSKLAELAKRNEEIEKSKSEEIERMKSEFEKEKIQSKIADLGINKFLALSPNLSNDEKKKANQLNLAKSELLKQNWKIEGDNILLLDKDGNPAVDKNYNPISFDKAVEEITGNFFDFSQSTQRTSPNANESDKKDEKKGILANIAKRPETTEEVLEMANDRQYSLEERKAIYQYGKDNGLV